MFSSDVANNQGKHVHVSRHAWFGLSTEISQQKTTKIRSTQKILARRLSIRLVKLENNSLGINIFLKKLKLLFTPSYFPPIVIITSYGKEGFTNALANVKRQRS
jgi:hypothetical protein